MAFGTEGFLQKALEAPGRTDADLKRDQTSKPAEVLAFFGVKPGMKITDLFSGDGYYSEILAHAVGKKGQVIAHNNQAYIQFLKDQAEARYANGNLKNVKRLVSEFENLQLEPNSQDMILMVLSYHDIYFVAQSWPKVDRDHFFSQVLQALKPGGIFAVVDHAAEAGTQTTVVNTLHRIDEAFAKQDIQASGLRFSGESQLLRNAKDDKTRSVFEPELRRKTDRFIMKFVKPKS